MKLSISLPEEDVALLDDVARKSGLRSRSAAVLYAIRKLRSPELEEDYAAAWNEWESAGEQASWEVTASDGFSDAAR